MKLYVGSRDYTPEGYLTLDIDPKYNPDIVGNITDLNNIIESCSVDEIIAGAVLEHIEWPDSFKAMSEMARALKIGGILKISVPDLELLCSLIASGKSSYYAIGIMFGVGRIDNQYEAHQYGFTKNMLLEILQVLGFSNFKFWSSNMPDSSNGWYPLDCNEKIFGQVNIECEKKYEPICDVKKLYKELKNNLLQNFQSIVSKCFSENISEKSLSHNIIANNDIIQSITMQLIEAKQRIKYLEEQLENK